MKQYVLANCADYNGYKDILFLMEAADFRLSDSRFSANYEVLDAKPAFDRKAKAVATTCGVFRVHADHSLTLITPPATYYAALRDAQDLMECGIRSALKQAASDRGIPFGHQMARFVHWAEKQMGVA